MGGVIFGLFISFMFMGIYVFVRVKEKHDDKKLKREMYDGELPALNKEIDELYCDFFGEKAGTSSKSNLLRLYGAVKEMHEVAWMEYISSNGIVNRCDTCSDLGDCGVSATYFFMNLDSPMANRVIFAGESKYPQPFDSNEECQRKIDRIRRVLPLYRQIKNEGIKITEKKIALDSIKCYKIEGSKQYSSNVEGGGVNLQGAAVGAVIGGGAAAIIGSQMGTETKTKIVEHDDRTITIFYEKEGRMVTLKVITESFDSTVSALRTLMPQKEESVVMIEAQNKPQVTAAVSSADELKKFKELLDGGVISQEEFDAKKKQLLGL